MNKNSETFKQNFLKEITEELNDKNPFISEDEKTFIRYDEIGFEPRKEEIVFIFKWRDKEIFRMYKKFIFGQDCSISLKGVEGRI